MIKYRLVRKKVKNINLRVNSSGEVIVSAPYFYPKFLIDNFVMSKQSWILKKQYSSLSNNDFTFDKNDRIRFKAKLDELIPKWENITGLYCKSYRIKNMVSRWGSCNPTTGNINLNLRLINKPEICLEYVILHELTHLKIPNHSREFYDFIEKYMPNYKNIIKILNSGE